MIQNMKTQSRRRFLTTSGAAITTVAGSGLFSPALAISKEVTIISNIGNAGQRDVLARLAKEFGEANGVTVTINNMDHEAHKTAIRSYLVVDAPDVCFWFSGNRMKAFVDRGLFDDISDLHESQGLAKALGGTQGAVTVDGKQYGLPTGGLLWGMFYRKDVFEENGWSAPKTWDEMLTLGESAKSAGMTPISMGTKNLWPTGGWFDHMNLRINGLEKHTALMDGQISYTDPMLAPVFDKWQEAIDAGLFPTEHTSYDWNAAAAILAQKKAAMMDLAGFIKYGFPEEDFSQIAYAPFPEIVPGMARYEDYSVNSVHVPAKAKNKQGARDFLAYFYKPENLAAFLEPEGAIPARNDCPPSSDPIVNNAVNELKSVVGTSQYYDRDTNPDMAQEGMKGFQEFMARPERREQILERLERTRARIFK